ncbi:MAG: hypothetical protein ACRDU0_10065 [Mycobacterium sp.]
MLTATTDSTTGTTDSEKLGIHSYRSGRELLVQSKLLKLGIDSARLTTDSGFDLVMPGSREASTIQVKAKYCSVPAGGKGKQLLSWTFPGDSPT